MEENKEEISEGFRLFPHNSEGWFLVMSNAIQFFIIYLFIYIFFLSSKFCKNFQLRV